MLVENQLVETTWTHKNKKYYENFGYKFTNYFDKLSVLPKHLTKTSKVHVAVVCDGDNGCNTLFRIPYFNYTKSIDNYDKYLCRSCSVKLGKKKEMLRNIPYHFKEFVDWCNNNAYIPISDESDYTEPFSKLYYRCPEHGVSHTTYNYIHSGQVTSGCCKGKWLRQYHVTSPNEARKIVEGKNGNKLLNPNDYINIKTKNLRIICGSCKNIFITNLASIKNSNGRCSTCGCRVGGKESKLTMDDLIRIFTIGNKVLLENSEDYTGYFDKNLRIRCPRCNQIYLSNVRRGKNNRTLLCDRCNQKTSVGEVAIINILDKYNIDYIFQKRFKDCKDKKPLPFDFYLPEYNTCIEFDGQGHFEPAFGNKSFFSTILHDGMKNNYCLWNNIRLIRIPYWEGHNIEEILVRDLNFKLKIKYIPYNMRETA